MLGFDIEIADDLPDTGPRPRNVGITCAGLAYPDVSTAHYAVGSRMSQEEAETLADTLIHHDGPIITWNGLRFDFPVLAEECGLSYLQPLYRLALRHIDIAFAMFCEKGFMVSLSSACQGMDLGHKLMSGAQAPVLWREGRKEEVIEYVKQDAQLTLDIYNAILKRDGLTWITKSGRRRTWRPFLSSGHMLTCRDALDIPIPDTSWMTHPPMPRDSFIEWGKQ